MEESLNRAAFLKEVDVETFTLFAEFAYTGNYRCIIMETDVTVGKELTTPVDEKATDENTSTHPVSRIRFGNVASLETYKIIQDHLVEDETRSGHCRQCSGRLVAATLMFPFCNQHCARIYAPYNNLDKYCILCAKAIRGRDAVCSRCAKKVEPGVQHKGLAGFQKKKIFQDMAWKEVIHRWLQASFSTFSRHPSISPDIQRAHLERCLHHF
jgi:hypothetical protein